MMHQNIFREIRKVRLDNRSGATALTARASKILERFSRSSRLPHRHFLCQLAALSRLLIHAQPAMVSIFNLANACATAMSKSRHGDPAQAVLATCEQFIESMHLSLQKIASNATPLIENGSVIVTHSFSSTVLQTLLAARSQNRKFRVICTESQPMQEGVALARSLAAARIPVTLVIDSAVFSFLPSASMVIVGADAVCRDGIVNKVGTMGIAQYARSHQVPVYVLTSSEKFFPASAPAAGFGATGKVESSRTGARQITVNNILFDLTPFGLVYRLITERGLERTAAIRSRLRNIRIHPFLRSMLTYS